MYLGKLLFAALAVAGQVTAEWYDQQWDAIIVGAGPAGIIGMCQGVELWNIRSD